MKFRNLLARSAHFVLLSTPLLEAARTTPNHDCRLPSSIAVLGPQYSYHATIRAGLAELGPSTSPILSREAMFLHIVEGLQIDVLNITVRDTELTWRIACAGEPIASSMRRGDATSVLHHVGEIELAIRTHVPAISAAKTRIGSSVGEIWDLEQAIQEDARIARHAQVTGSGGQAVSAIKAQERGNKNSLRLLRDLPGRLSGPARKITGAAGSCSTNSTGDKQPLTTYHGF